jgi:hypothetical protein
LKVERGSNQHEWGHGGERLTTYLVLDREKRECLMIETVTSWSTTSDDSTDYDEGTAIRILAAPEFMDLAIHAVHRITAAGQA